MKITKFAEKFNDVLNIINYELDFKIRRNSLLDSVLSSRESIVSAGVKDDHGNSVVVSFTTYSKRIHDVHLVIESIAKQTIKPKRIILWLDENEFTLDTIPLTLKSQMERGLEVRFCENLKSYKKLIPTLELGIEDNIITIDDDVLYPHDMIELLVQTHKVYPDCIVANRIHQIVIKDGEIAPYDNWVYESHSTTPSLLNVAIGVGGVLYPKRCFVQEVMNKDLFMSLCPTADDIWFKAMSLVKEIKVVKTNDNRDFWKRYLTNYECQDIALSDINVFENQNDQQIKAVFDAQKVSVLRQCVQDNHCYNLSLN
jgi:hypothetical protein